MTAIGEPERRVEPSRELVRPPVELLGELGFAIGARGVWLQLGIVNDEAVRRAAAAGLLAVQDCCSKIELTRALAPR